MLVLTQESIWKICIKISKNIVYFYQFVLIRWCIQKLTLIYRAHDSMQRVSVCQILSKLLVLWISLVFTITIRIRETKRFFFIFPSIQLIRFQKCGIFIYEIWSIFALIPKVCWYTKRNLIISTIKMCLTV